jgi:hypothetical protein
MTRLDVGHATDDVTDGGHVLGEDCFGCVADQRTRVGYCFGNS